QAAQGKGIGKALLLASLWSLREMGYDYAIIGAAGPVRFYQKSVGAIIIPDSEPGIYTDLLKAKDEYRRSNSGQETTDRSRPDSAGSQRLIDHGRDARLQSRH